MIKSLITFPRLLAKVATGFFISIVGSFDYVSFKDATNIFTRKALDEAIRIADFIGFGLETKIDEVVTVSELQKSTIDKPLTDGVALNNVLFLNRQDYAIAGYFLQDYTGESFTFTE